MRTEERFSNCRRTEGFRREEEVEMEVGKAMGVVAKEECERNLALLGFFSSGLGKDVSVSFVQSNETGLLAAIQFLLGIIFGKRHRVLKDLRLVQDNRRELKQRTKQILQQMVGSGTLPPLAVKTSALNLARGSAAYILVWSLTLVAMQKMHGKMAAGLEKLELHSVLEGRQIVSEEIKESEGKTLDEMCEQLSSEFRDIREYKEELAKSREAMKEEIKQLDRRIEDLEAGKKAPENEPSRFKEGLMELVRSPKYESLKEEITELLRFPEAQCGVKIGMDLKDLLKETIEPLVGSMDEAIQEAKKHFDENWMKANTDLMKEEAELGHVQTELEKRETETIQLTVENASRLLAARSL